MRRELENVVNVVVREVRTVVVISMTGTEKRAGMGVTEDMGSITGIDDGSSIKVADEAGSPSEVMDWSSIRGVEDGTTNLGVDAVNLTL